MRRSYFLLLVLLPFLFASASTAWGQGQCMPVYSPPGLETGDFSVGIWVAEGPMFMGGKQYQVSVWIQDNGGRYVGKAAQTLKGTETAIYDFGNGNTFTTAVSYVSVHSNDPNKFYLNDSERIVEGTGIFANAKGMLSFHGPFGADDDTFTTGWGLFTGRGVICGVASEN